jgi:hypothetical protein
MPVNARRSECDYLARQAADAKAAMARAMNDFRCSAADAADPRRWARAHPWATMGLGLFGALAAVKAVKGGKRRRNEPMARQKQEEADAKPWWLRLLVQEAFSIIRPIVASIVAAAAFRCRSSSSADTGSDGHHA